MGKKVHSAKMSSIECTIPKMRCIEQLSKITTECGFTPLKGIKYGSRLVCRMSMWYEPH